jgi:hypothetical protein
MEVFMSSHTRRQALAVAAAAFPILSSMGADAAAPSNPDAELIRLGQQFDVLVERYETALRLSEPNWRAQDAAVEELKREITIDGVLPPVSNEKLKETLTRVAREVPPPSPSCDDIGKLMGPIEKQIMGLRPHTCDGLKVKARLAKFSCPNLWDKAAALDWEDKVVRNLIEATLEVAAGGPVT